MSELDDLREEVRGLIEDRAYRAIGDYLHADGDCGDDPAPDRYAAVDVIYHGEHALGEYDNKHGVDDGVSDMEIRTPAMAMVHELLAEAWHEGNG